MPRRYFRQMKGLDSTTHVRSEEEIPTQDQTVPAFSQWVDKIKTLDLHKVATWHNVELETPQGYGLERSRTINAEPIDS